MTSFRVRFESVLAVACLLFLALPASAEDEDEGQAYPGADQWQLPEPDTSRWGCRNCPTFEGWSGWVELGAGSVSDDSFEFGDFRGLEEEGGFGVLGADVRFRGDDGGYVDFTAEELGLDSRSARIEGGDQGSYGAWFEYDELSHFVSDDTRTPFRGAGSSNLTLPGGWVRAPSTGGMSQLDNSLRDVDIEQERESLGAGFDLLGGDRWRFDIEARQDTVEGNRIQGGSFLFDSALLPAPVDYQTDRVDASLAYVRERWQVEAALHSSMFTNENESLEWDNPFTSGSGADRGRLAQAPDNQFNQLSLSGSWRSRDSLRVAGRIALGQMEQDEDFLAPTTNSGLSVPALPRNDLDGEVNTRKLDLRITGQPLERLTAGVEFHYDERDNDTPRAEFTQVVTDSLVGASETNQPFGYERSGAEFTLDYRFSSRLTLATDVGHEEVDRDFVQSGTTETDSLAVEARGRPTERIGVRLRQTLEERDSNNDPAALPAGANPDLRSFYLAERDRSETLLAVDWLIGETTVAAFSAEFGQDEYTDTDIGLADGETRGLTFDLSTNPAEGVSVYGFLSLQRIDTEIGGIDNLVSTPWTGDQRDEFETIGAGAEVADLPGKWTRGGLNFTYAAGEGSITVDKGGPGTPFPELKTQRLTLELFANRKLRKDLDLRVGYLVEDLRQDDFHLDGVEPDTIPSVLTLGEESADDTVQVIHASLRYRF